MNNNKTVNLVIAGTVSALLLAVGLLFSQQPTPVAQAESDPITISQPIPLDPDLSLQQQVDEMAQREAQYVEQINIANELLAQQAEQSAYGEYEEDEYEEEDHDEYEHEEDHDEYEEDDDDEYEDD